MTSPHFLLRITTALVEEDPLHNERDQTSDRAEKVRNEILHLNRDVIAQFLWVLGINISISLCAERVVPQVLILASHIIPAAELDAIGEDDGSLVLKTNGDCCAVARAALHGAPITIRPPSANAAPITESLVITVTVTATVLAASISVIAWAFRERSMQRRASRHKFWRFRAMAIHSIAAPVGICILLFNHIPHSIVVVVCNRIGEYMCPKQGEGYHPQSQKHKACNDDAFSPFPMPTRNKADHEDDNDVDDDPQRLEPELYNLLTFDCVLHVLARVTLQLREGRLVGACGGNNKEPTDATG